MGYAGYVPAKMPPPMPTAIQEAMWQIQDIACLETITKLLRNTVVNPTEDKYRRIRLSNPKIKSLIMGRAGLQTLRALGWVQDAEDEDMLVLPKNAQLSMAEVRMVQDAEERLKKSTSIAKRSAAASKLPLSKEQARIKEQMEADRQERLSQAAR